MTLDEMNALIKRTERHTQEPWVSTIDNDQECYKVLGPEGSSECVERPAEREYIASVYELPNAALVVLAPEIRAALEEAIGMLEWVSVDDRLPPDDQGVLFTDGNVVYSGQCVNGKWFPYGMSKPINQKDITHWKSLIWPDWRNSK